MFHLPSDGRIAVRASARNRFWEKDTVSPMRLLIVDDDRGIARAVQQGLEAEGFVTVVAHDGIDGLWLAQEESFDVIILDLMLPGLSGYEVCRRLREEESQVPILMLTAKDGEHDEADALDLGADDYLSKPFSYTVLLARIRALLRRAPVARGPLLTAGDLTLDPASRRCWRGVDEVRLSTREFALLELLVRRQGQVLSRAVIAENVWDAELDIDSNVVQVYIGYLRRKVDDPFGRHDIETIRGGGYRLADPRSVGIPGSTP